MPGLGHNFCSYLLKTLAIVFGLIGVIFTAESQQGCDFLNVQDTDGDILDLIRDGDRKGFVFGAATKMRVGIFMYEIQEGSVTPCQDYPQKFFDIEDYPSLTWAQLCSTISPIFCAIGVIATVIDFCICTFRGSSIFGGIFYFLAMATQCGVFGIIADPVFCFEDSELECTIGSEANLVIAAVIFYFLATCFSCCAPNSDPCYKTVIGGKDKDNNNDGVVGSNHNTTTTTTTTTTTKRATIVQDDTGPGGRRRSRLGAQDNDPDSKYDKHGNRVFY